MADLYRLSNVLKLNPLYYIAGPAERVVQSFNPAVSARFFDAAVESGIALNNRVSDPAVLVAPNGETQTSPSRA